MAVQAQVFRAPDCWRGRSDTSAPFNCGIHQLLLRDLPPSTNSPRCSRWPRRPANSPSQPTAFYVDGSWTSPRFWSTLLYPTAPASRSFAPHSTTSSVSDLINSVIQFCDRNSLFQVQEWAGCSAKGVKRKE